MRTWGLRMHTRLAQPRVWRRVSAWWTCCVCAVADSSFCMWAHLHTPWMPADEGSWVKQLTVTSCLLSARRTSQSQQQQVQAAGSLTRHPPALGTAHSCSPTRPSRKRLAAPLSQPSAAAMNLNGQDWDTVVIRCGTQAGSCARAHTGVHARGALSGAASAHAGYPTSRCSSASAALQYRQRVACMLRHRAGMWQTAAHAGSTISACSITGADLLHKLLAQGRDTHAHGRHRQRADAAAA